MSTKTLKSTATFLPEEIIHVILLRLPVRSLLRFRAVCKSWRSIISASTFIHTQLQLNCRERQLLLLQASPKRTTSNEPFSLHRDNPSFDEYTKLRNPFLAYDRIQYEASVSKRKYIALGTMYIDVAGTCNGLVCLVAHDLTVLIWNPSIQKYVVLAKPSVTFIGDDPTVNYAFGHDSCTDDYKVLRSVIYRGARTSCQVDIWSLARGSWKNLTASIDIPGDDPYYPNAFLLEPHAFVNGALHWCHRFKMTNYNNNSIVSFDISSESFGEITMPELWGKKNICSISRYMDYTLAFSEQDFTFRLTLWVMKEYGVGDSCTRMFTIPFQAFTITDPFWFTNSGDVVFDLKGVLMSVDCKTKYTTKFRISNYVYYNFMDYFVESLVLLDKHNAISY